jgi:phage tail protein X
MNRWYDRDDLAMRWYSRTRGCLAAEAKAKGGK